MPILGDPIYVIRVSKFVLFHFLNFQIQTMAHFKSMMSDFKSLRTGAWQPQRLNTPFSYNPSTFC